MANFKWHYRVVVLHGDDGFMKNQLKAFRETEEEVKDRDLLILSKRSGLVSSSDWLIVQEKFGLKAGNHLILIGKDGGIKLEKLIFTDPQKIFDLIDTMPMRRMEMGNH